MIQNLLDRMKFPFRKNREFVSVLHDLLGFYPHDIEIYRVAFSHKSYTNGREAAPAARRERRGRDRYDRRNRRDNADRPQRPLNNERLEYLGDAVLETVVSDILFRHFPNQHEGFLTATRSKIVQREALNRLAAEIGLERLILAAQTTRMSQTNIGGNAFEALMGAIYLDRGFKHCHWFISNRVVGRLVDLDNVAQKEVNFKSKLLEWSQKNRIHIQIKDTADANGRKGFSTVIRLEGIIIGRGDGRSKKESQQEAAKDALTRMRQERKTYESIFQAKEKRTSMEADEAFALPKIDEIEETLAKSAKRNGRGGKEKLPVLEEKDGAKPQSQADAAYDTAYDAEADYEVIDTAPRQPQLSAADYEAIGIPAPPAESDLAETEAPVQKRQRPRTRGAKTVGDAVKGISKGDTTPEEKAARTRRQPKTEATGKAEKAEAPETPMTEGTAEAPAKPRRARRPRRQEQTAEKPSANGQPVNERAEEPAKELSTEMESQPAVAQEVPAPSAEALAEKPKPRRRRAACKPAAEAEATPESTEATPAAAETKSEAAVPVTAGDAPAADGQPKPAKPKAPRRRPPRKDPPAAE